MKKILNFFIRKKEEKRVEESKVVLPRSIEDKEKYREEKLDVVIYPNCIEAEDHLLYLLSKNLIIVNNGWWDKDWPKDKITLAVICNDLFAWGCADAEDIDFSDLEELYNADRKDPDYGISAWVIKRRKVRPQPPVEKEMVKAGYDIKKLIKGES